MEEGTSKEEWTARFGRPSIDRLLVDRGIGMHGLHTLSTHDAHLLPKGGSSAATPCRQEHTATTAASSTTSATEGPRGLPRRCCRCRRRGCCCLLHVGAADIIVLDGVVM